MNKELSVMATEAESQQTAQEMLQCLLDSRDERGTFGKLLFEKTTEVIRNSR
jgi:hypothetical protein